MGLVLERDVKRMHSLGTLILTESVIASHASKRSIPVHFQKNLRVARSSALYAVRSKSWCEGCVNRVEEHGAATPVAISMTILLLCHARAVVSSGRQWVRLRLGLPCGVRHAQLPTSAAHGSAGSASKQPVSCAVKSEVVCTKASARPVESCEFALAVEL